MSPEIPIRADRSLEREFPEVHSLASDCVINLWRANAMLSEEMGRVLRPYDLTLTGFRVVMMLRVAGGTLTPAEIADRLGSARATVTGVLDSLEKRELVRRLPHPDDRRRLQVEITPQARSLLDELLPTYFEHERVSVAALDEESQETLVQLLGTVQRGLYNIRSAASDG
jgi:DNA-binding MarR family transcriptional regulator